MEAAAVLFDGVLLASDYDGTLVGADGISDEVRRAIRFFISNGGRLTVCTGRTLLGFHAYSPEIINAPVVLANGGMTYDYARGEIAAFSGIDDEGIAPLRAVMRMLPQVCIEMYPLQKAYAINLSKQSEQHFRIQNISFETVADPADAPKPWAKVMLSGNLDDTQRAQQVLSNYPQVSFLPTNANFLEVLGKGVNKGAAIADLASSLNITSDNVYAIGDSYNDVAMLRAAHVGFVPSNGNEQARAAGDVIVRSNEDGAVANVIEILARMYGGSYA